MVIDNIEIYVDDLAGNMIKANQPQEGKCGSAATNAFSKCENVIIVSLNKFDMWDVAFIL